MTSRTRMKRKAVDDVLGGEDHWKHADSTTGPPSGFISFIADVSHFYPTLTHQNPAQCDKCDHDRAYFYQLQIRSADEPMTTCECIFLAVAR
jgi:DNA-directed RNA polymerase III subunit RPC11